MSDQLTLDAPRRTKEGYLAERSDQRKAIDLQLLDLKYQELRLEQQAILDNADATKAQKAIAQARLDTLGVLQKSDTSRVDQQYRGSYDTYRKGIAGDFATLQETVDGIKVDALKSLEDTLVNSAKAALGLSGALGDVVGQIIRIGIERRLIGPIADALFGKAGSSSGGGIGGLLSSVIGAITGSKGQTPSTGKGLEAFAGRASGGYVSAGEMYRVNEAGSPGNVEGFRPAGSGTIIPLGQMNASERGGGAITIHVQANDYFDARVAKVSGPIADRSAVRIVQSAAPALIGESVKQSSRAAPAAVARSRRLGTTI